MLGVKDIKQTRVYQEGIEQGIEQVAWNLLQMGMNLDQISLATGLTIERIQQLSLQGTDLEQDNELGL